MSFDPALFGESENQGQITFDYQIEDFQVSSSDRIQHWIQTIIDQANCQLFSLNFIFCTDPFLHQINVEYLNHDTLTDIITFPFQEPPAIEGEIYISLDRIRENAAAFKVPFEEELHRVIIHGVLHLCGQGDKTDLEQAQMRQREDQALQVLMKLSF